MGYAKLVEESRESILPDKKPLMAGYKSGANNGQILANGPYKKTDKSGLPQNGRPAIEYEDSAEYGDTKSESESRNFIQRIFPTGFRHELIELLKFSWPMIASTLLNTSIRSMATMFSGHLGKIELDSVAMALSIANVIGTSIGIGLIAACDTLFSQSFGSSNKLQVGVYLQTAVYVSSLCCVVSWALLANTNQILLGLGQDPLVSHYTEEYLDFFMPALMFTFVYQLAARYLQVQGYVIPIVVIGVLANLINVGLQYLLVYTADLRLRGSAISQVVAYFCLGAFTIIYAKASGAYKGTWGGFSRSSLKDWGQFFKLGFSSIMMICLEWWAFEIGTFLMGILGATELGASACLMTMWSFYSAVSVGVGSAAAYRIGRYLGSGRPQNAITAARVAFCCAWTVAFVTAIITLALKSYLPYMFTGDPDVISLASELLPILAIFSFFGATRNICSGIIRGTGNQAMGGLTSFISYFIIGLPIGIPLMFLTAARASGFWWGLTIGLGINATSLFIIIFKIDWISEVEKAQVRAKVKASITRQTSVFDGPEAVDSWSTSETAALISNRMKSALQKDTRKEKLSSDIARYGTIADEKSATRPPDKSGLSESFNLREKQRTDRQQWIKLYITRGFTCLCAFGVLGFGIVCRTILFIPPDIPTDYFGNSTTTANMSIHLPS